MPERPVTFAEAEVVLAQALPGYESRPQQQAFAEAVENALATRRHLIAEAGCGTGKSLGYAIPAILHGERVIISTATKALQEQLADKDMPFLAEHLGVPFSFTVLKGRANYFCTAKALEVMPDEVPAISRLLAEAAQDGFDGERSSFTVEVTDAEWRRVCSEGEDCRDYDCKSRGDCFAELARQRAKDAQVVIVNHALFVTDLVVRQMTGGVVSMLDEYDVVVFDEAHELEEYAASNLGGSFGEGTVRSLLSEVRNFLRRDLQDQAEDVEEEGRKLQVAMSALWEVLQPGRIREANLVQAQEQYEGFIQALYRYANVVSEIDIEGVSPAEVERVSKKKRRLVRRARSAAQKFADVVLAPFIPSPGDPPAMVRWVEEEKRFVKGGRGRQEVQKFIRYSPIDVSEILRPLLFEASTAILVSATLLVEGKADYIAGRLGVDEYDVIDVGTPFDYATQSVLYVPEDLPSPEAKTRAQWEAMSVHRMGELVKASDGRALLLFTSTKQMRSAYDTLADRLPYTCLMQGQAANKVLAERFKEDTHSVLFATRSFFTGVDFQGETLSLLVIDKLPFPVPTEPLFEARTEAIEAQGGDAFRDYTIPFMALILKQGHGRLIRHRGDTGVVAILDPRLKSKGYGRIIVRSLPPSREVRKLEDVESFFGVVAA